MKKTKKNSKPKNNDSQVKEYIWKDITYTCPVRGKVTQKIKVAVLKPQDAPESKFEIELPFLKETDDVE